MLLNSKIKVHGVILILLSFPISLWAHAEDERSHQVITFMPDTSGANIQFDLYCGPKLGSTLMMAEVMYKQFPDIVEEDFDPNLLALLGKVPWIEVKAGVLLEPLQSGNLQSSKIENPKPLNLKEHLEKFKGIEENPLKRHRIFEEESPSPVGKYQKINLKLLEPGRRTGSWFPPVENIDELPSENLLLSFRYRMSWPQEFSLTQGVVLSVSTSLKVFTSNSVFHSLKPESGELIADGLQEKQGTMRPEEFLNVPPSSRFKLRKALYFFSLPED